LAPAFAQMFRVLRDDAFCISFYGWNRVDRFFAAWRAAGFRVVGHIVFAKQYQSKARFLAYQHEARPTCWLRASRSEEHTSELQSLMRISYAVFCLQKKNT